MVDNSQSNIGLFIPTTNVWDIQNLEDPKDISPALKELLIRLYQNINYISVALNLKDSGYYVQQEFLTGQLFFPNFVNDNTSNNGRQAFRMVVNFGALPNNGTLSVAHGINVQNSFIFTRMYGCASNQTTTTYLPIPYSSATTAKIIEMYVDATNVYITTSSDLSSYTQTLVILEYVKQ